MMYNIKYTIILIIILIFNLIFFSSCFNEEISFEEPECNSEFIPYQLYSGLYDVVEDNDDYFEKKRFYAVCNKKLILSPKSYDDYSKLIFESNSLSKKSYLRLAHTYHDEYDFPNYYDIKFDSILLVHDFILAEPEFINLYSTDFTFSNPAKLNMAFEVTTYNEYSSYNISIYDVKIYKIDPKNQKIIEEMDDCKTEIIDIGGFSTVSGIASIPLSELGTFAVGVPLRLANQPTSEGGNLNVSVESSIETKNLNYNSEFYGSAYFDKVEQKPYTEIYLNLSSTGMDISGHALIRFEGNSLGTYPLNEINKASFVYLENNEIKYANTTGLLGEIIIQQYDPLGGDIIGEIQMNTNAGGINQDLDSVRITADFNVKHRLPWPKIN